MILRSWGYPTKLQALGWASSIDQGILPTVLQYSNFRKLNESEHAEERLLTYRSMLVDIIIIVFKNTFNNQTPKCQCFTSPRLG